VKQVHIYRTRGDISRCETDVILAKTGKKAHAHMVVMYWK